MSFFIRTEDPVRGLLDRLFVAVRDGEYVTRSHGWFGAWRRVTGEQKDRLTQLYRCAAEGVVLLTALALCRWIFGGVADLDDLFNCAGFAFGLMIFMTQTWLLGDAPEVSGPARGTTDVGKPAPFAPMPDFIQASVVIAAFLLSTAVLAIGLVLGETALSIGGVAGTWISGLLLQRVMLRLWRSRR